MTSASSTPAVTVVVPAFNATRTLAATLESALSQTCGDLEILVVDDGSQDGTAELARAYVQRDARVRLLQQPNGGVARARNLGVAHARGRFISPLDADDLWHPLKLERQLKAFSRGGPGTGLAYCWSRYLDSDARVLTSFPSVALEGDVLIPHLAWNFIGNGSAPLIDAGLLKQIGYDPGLRDAGAQGCEDYLMQLRVAQRATFVCAPEFLVGYRATPESMSSDNLQMARSGVLAFSHLRKDLSGAARKIARSRQSEYQTYLALRQVKDRAYASALSSLLSAATLHPRVPLPWIWRHSRARAAWVGASPSSPGPDFLSLPIEATFNPSKPPQGVWWEPEASRLAQPAAI